ncbi:MAG: hypothetical protein K9H84_01675 [Bacteroidales bacterium]|nr:hypothetical protein [Bacteroidales bacterium]
MTSNFKNGILILVLLISGLGCFSQETVENPVNDIYGNAYTIHSKDTAVIMVYLKYPSCAGCKKLLFKYLRETYTATAHTYILHENFSGALRRRSALEDARQVWPGSDVLFFDEKKCSKNHDFYKLTTLQKSPIVAYICNDKVRTFEFDEVFFQILGILIIKNNFKQELNDLLTECP